MNLPSRWMMLALLAASLVGLAGCQRAPMAGRSDIHTGKTYPRIMVTGELLQGDLLHNHLFFGEAILEPRTADQPMRVMQPARSTSYRELNVQYRFEFFDAQGHPVRSNPGWQYVRMLPRVETFLVASAQDLDAVDYRLTVRPAQ